MSTVEAKKVLVNFSGDRNHHVIHKGSQIRNNLQDLTNVSVLVFK